MTRQVEEKLLEWAEKYEDPVYFEQDPIAFPREFLRRGSCLEDIEIASVFSAHFAWGRRAMIVRDSQRLFDEMQWRPYDYVMAGDYRNDDSSAHRTVKWSEVAQICSSLREFYLSNPSLENLGVAGMREKIFNQRPDAQAPNKKINMLRRWMVRQGSRVDLGLWKNSCAKDLIVPLDVHVYDMASELGLTSRKSKDIRTALEITESFKSLWPEDPLKGDFALFGYGVTHKAETDA